MNQFEGLFIVQFYDRLCLLFVFDRNQLYYAGMKNVYMKQQQQQKLNSTMTQYNDEEQLKKTLTRDQFSVTRRKQTQEPYTNKYWNNFKPGVYKCVVCNCALFSSECKYEDGFGWPAFFDELPFARIKKQQDHTLDYIRQQAICGQCGSHLGYIFADGPKDKTGRRYCVNSASLSFEQGETTI